MTFQKLRNSQQFRRVYDQGQRFHTPHFSVFILRTEGSERRIGITVTRKIGNAVLRNRCKRRLREILRSCLSEASAGDSDCDRSGFDMVINAKSGLAEADSRELETGFRRVIAKFFESLRRQKGGS
ncbi:MAG: ribonuclease P protein component [Blastocatellia bacterium]